MLDLDSIRRRLAAHEPVRYTPGENTRQAAVAVVLREGADDTEVLFIKRAVKEGDPWSGDMAFPGGHLDRTDDSLKAAAMRETHEEIGVDLTGAAYIGELSQQRPMAARRDILVAPYVFEIEGDPMFAMNHEVADVVWTPLTPMHRGDNHDRETWQHRSPAVAFNGFRLSERHFVWGMTYRMVQTFFESIDPHYQRHPE